MLAAPSVPQVLQCVSSDPCTTFMLYSRALINFQLINIADYCSVAIYLVPLLARLQLAFRKIWGPFIEVCILKGEGKVTVGVY